MSDKEYWDAIEAVPQAIEEHYTKENGLNPYKVTWKFLNGIFESSRVFYAKSAVEAEEMFKEWIKAGFSKIKEYKIRKA